jgi:hypothetical protein
MKAGSLEQRSAEFVYPRWIEHTYFFERRLTPVTRLPAHPIFRDAEVCTVLPGPEDGLRMWFLTCRSRFARIHAFRIAAGRPG